MTTVRRVATTHGGAGFPHPEQGLDSGELPFIKVSDFNHPGNERTITHCANWVSRVTARRLGASVVPSGALLMPKVGAAMLGNARRLTSQPSVFDNNVLAVVPNGIESRYLYYWLGTIDTAAFAKPGPIPSMGDDALLDLVVPTEELAYQRAIADYLDTKTARIDALIAKKQRLIRLLDERRLAVIDDAITTVSGPSVPVRRLSSRITSGPRGWAEYVSEAGTPFIRITNIQRNQIDLDMSDTLLVNAPQSAESDRTRVRTDDVLVSITADIGSVGLATREHEGANISQHVALVRPENCEAEWLAYAVRSTPARFQLDSGQYGGTKTQLSLDDIASLRVPYPDISAQSRQLARLRQALATIDSCTSRLRVQIGLLGDSRRAVISDALTGQSTVHTGGLQCE